MTGNHSTDRSGWDEDEPVQSAVPSPPTPIEVRTVSAVLDPVLTPLGFASGQAGVSGREGQVIFCRGMVDGIDDGCVDLVVEVGAAPEWRVTAVRYWGFPSATWHLDFPHQAALAEQLTQLARTLPVTLAGGGL